MAKIVGDYFKLDEPLYPDFIHLVCRYPLDVKEDDGEGNLILRKLLLKYCSSITDFRCLRQPI